METITINYFALEPCRLNGYHGAIDRANNRRLFPFCSYPTHYAIAELRGYIAKDAIDDGSYHIVVPGVE